MTVKELIEELKTLPQDFTIKLFEAEGIAPKGLWDNVGHVELLEKIEQVWIWTATGDS
jgi:hypothetical protein